MNFKHLISELLVEANKRDVLITKLGLNEKNADVISELCGPFSVFIANKIIDQRPFNSYSEFIDKASKKGSGINSRAISALNAIGGAAFEDNARSGNEKDSYYEYLGIPTFNLEGIPPRIKAQARPIEDFDDLGSFIMFGMVKSIKRGNGWARVELVDETGSIGLFHTEQTQIETGQMYFILVGDNRIARYVKVSDISFDSEDIFVNYLYKKEYDLEEDEAQDIYNEIVAGEYDIEQFMDDARENDIWFDFDWMDEDDWWTDRKGGYDVTYEVIEGKE
jgi:hypothetical protein